MSITVKDAIASLSALDPDLPLAVYIAELGTLTASTAHVAGFTVEPSTGDSTPHWMKHPARVIVDYDFDG